MNIDSIKNGIVLDHITAGKGMDIYYQLGLDKLDCSIAIIQNAKSNKLGKKTLLRFPITLISIWMCWDMWTPMPPYVSLRTES